MTERLWIFAGLIAGLPRAPMVDLGAGHCKFSRLAHTAGFPVTSIDARAERVPDDLAWPFVQQDVRTVDLRPWSIVLILGLLYHLTLDDQVLLLERCRGKLTIVDTFFADAKSSRLCIRKDDSNGGIYTGIPFAEVESDATAAFGNAESFWLTEESLLRLFADHGFKATKVLPEHVVRRSFYLLQP